ncbi:hypothetical protein NDU88_001805 [Pleurodeles waltl]|uniref:Uncharacterized protein n=1 Tax=Pleurodeles waltl TaxID=8319 RepID=A0AAV7SB43_PLEWA|nr:hypothetical protein NDU88_001805 [Pleurodeles waltl]
MPLPPRHGAERTVLSVPTKEVSRSCQLASTRAMEALTTFEMQQAPTRYVTNKEANWRAEKMSHLLQEARRLHKQEQAGTAGGPRAGRTGTWPSQAADGTGGACSQAPRYRLVCVCSSSEARGQETLVASVAT